jgi:hypothetical protein
VKKANTNLELLQITLPRTSIFKKK